MAKSLRSKMMKRKRREQLKSIEKVRNEKIASRYADLAKRLEEEGTPIKKIDVRGIKVPRKTSRRQERKSNWRARKDAGRNDIYSVSTKKVVRPEKKKSGRK